MSPWFALGLGPALQPWALIGAGAATVIEAKLSSRKSYLALGLFCLLASASYLFMEICTVFKPGQSQALLARFRTWIDTHTDQVIISGSLILGFWLLEPGRRPVRGVRALGDDSPVSYPLRGMQPAPLRDGLVPDCKRRSMGQGRT